MSHGTEHHLEEAEHAKHGVHNPFDRRVATTMAIIAAVLATVTMLSHRAHNATLRLQAESNSHQTEAGIKQVEASNNWAWYQAKRLRQAQYESYILQMPLLAPAPGSEEKAKTVVAGWQKSIDEYKAELKDIKAKAEKCETDSTALKKKAEEKLEASHEVHQQGDRFDLSELAVEMGLVLCSLAVLTKLAPFWYSGVGFGLLGAAVALSAHFGWMMGHGH